MKVKKILCTAIAFALLLAGCAGHGKTAQGGTDYNQYICRRGAVCWTEDAGYLYNEGTLRVQDEAGEGTSTLLCTRADCTHGDTECSAWLQTAGIYGWQNDLYYIAQDDEGAHGLYRMDVDGTQRIKLMELTMLDVMSEQAGYQVGYSYDIYGGYMALFVAASVGEETNKRLLLYDLQHPETDPEVIFESTTKTVSRMYLRDGWLLYACLAEEDNLTSDLYAHPIGGESVLLQQGWAIRSATALQGDTLYWCTFNDGAYVADLTTGEIRRLCHFPHLTDLGSEAYDDQYMYLANAGDTADSGGLSIRDYEGNEKLYLSYDGLQDSLLYLYSTPDKVFFSYTARKSDGLTPVFYLDKSAIADGTAEFVPVG